MRLSQQLASTHVLLKKPERQDRQGSEDYVIQGQVGPVKHGLSGERREEGEKDLSSDESDILQPNKEIIIKYFTVIGFDHSVCRFVCLLIRLFVCLSVDCQLVRLSACSSV